MIILTANRNMKGDDSLTVLNDDGSIKKVKYVG